MLIYIVLYWLIPSIMPVDGSSFEKDLTLTYPEKLTLDKFSSLVKSRLPHDYMKKDIYLIRWLRARNFNIPQAERMLMENIRWRKDNRMDGILKEDFSDMEKDYKYYIRGFDVEEKPVAYFQLGTWDIRKLVLSSSINRAIRYLDKYLEEITSLVRKMQDEGRNVTQFSFVMNLDGFNAVEHTCAQCLPAYLNFINSYENHFPGSADNMFFVNTPRIFELVLNSARFTLSQRTRDALKVYGPNKNIWQSKLFKVIPRDQLPPEVGGTQIYDKDDY